MDNKRNYSRVKYLLNRKLEKERKASQASGRYVNSMISRKSGDKNRTQTRIVSEEIMTKMPRTSVTFIERNGFEVAFRKLKCMFALDK